MTLRCRPALALAFVVVLASSAGTAAGPPAVHWRRALPGWGQPAVDGATAYVLTRGHEIAALDTDTGAIRWRSYTGGPGEIPLGSSVRLSDRHVIVGDDAIAAFDRRTGRPAWRFVPAGGGSPGVFLGDSAAGLILAGSLNGQVHAVDAASGALRWSARPATAKTAVYPPVVAGDRVLVAFTRFEGALSGGVAAFDLTGHKHWSQPLPAGLGATGAVVVDDARVLVAITDGSIRAFSLRTGRPLWTLAARRLPGQTAGRGRDIRALVRCGRLLVAASLNGELIAYDLDTRRTRWRYTAGPSGAAALRLSADATRVYAPYTDGSLVAVAIATGRESWRTAPGQDALEWPPGADGSRLIAAGSTGIVALDPGTVGTSTGTGTSREDR